VMGLRNPAFFHHLLQAEYAVAALARPTHPRERLRSPGAAGPGAHDVRSVRARHVRTSAP
jgi:hypothetical protein